MQQKIIKCNKERKFLSWHLKHALPVNCLNFHSTESRSEVLSIWSQHLLYLCLTSVWAFFSRFFFWFFDKFLAHKRRTIEVKRIKIEIKGRDLIISGKLWRTKDGKKHLRWCVCLCILSFSVINFSVIWRAIHARTLCD